MLSRNAESVYWMSRYIERAENVARFLDVNYALSLDESSTLNQQWSPLVHTTGDQDLFAEFYSEANRENVIRFLAFDPRNPNSILSCVKAARENARTVRDIITEGMWEQINRFYLLVTNADQQGPTLGDPHLFCSEVRQASHLVVGELYTTMSHGEPWQFCRLGRLLERADKTSRIVDVQYFLLLPKPLDVGSSLDVIRWAALLRSTSALEMYRHDHGKITPAQVADFLIMDRLFPRSFHRCLIQAQNSLSLITGNPIGTFSCKSEQLMGQLRAVLDYTRIEDIIQTGMHEFIDGFQSRLNEIGEAIHRDFFTVTSEPRQYNSFLQKQQ